MTQNDQELMAVEFTLEERRAILAVLHSGLTTGALTRLNLEDLCRRMSAPYDGPWQYSKGQKIPSLTCDYGFAPNQSLHTRKY